MCICFASRIFNENERSLTKLHKALKKLILFVNRHHSCSVTAIFCGRVFNVILTWLKIEPCLFRNCISILSSGRHFVSEGNFIFVFVKTFSFTAFQIENIKRFLKTHLALSRTCPPFKTFSRFQVHFKITVFMITGLEVFTHPS